MRPVSSRFILRCPGLEGDGIVNISPPDAFARPFPGKGSLRR